MDENEVIAQAEAELPEPPPRVVVVMLLPDGQLQVVPQNVSPLEIPALLKMATKIVMQKLLKDGE